MAFQICPGCSRSIEPLERLEKDKKKHKTWKILYCPNTRCNFNIELTELEVRLWNNDKGYFENWMPKP